MNRKTSVSSGRIPAIRLMSEMTDAEDEILARQADLAMRRMIKKSAKKGVKK